MIPYQYITWIRIHVSVYRKLLLYDAQNMRQNIGVKQIFWSYSTHVDHGCTLGKSTGILYILIVDVPIQVSQREGL